MKKTIFFLLMTFVFYCKSPKPETGSSSGITVPDQIFKYSVNYPNSIDTARAKIVGKWMYANNQFFEFKADKTWEYYISYDGGTTKYVYYNGNYEVYENLEQANTYYLALSYNNIGVSNPNSGNPSPQLYSYDPYGIADVPKKRYQIIELYVDDNIFGMNIYRNKNNKFDFLSDWVHANFDFFNNYWTYLTIVPYATQTYFENTILSTINNDKTFVQSCYTDSGGNYNNTCTTDPDKTKLNDILTTYVSGYGESEPPSSITSEEYSNYISSIDSSFVSSCYYLLSGNYYLKTTLSEEASNRLERIMLGKKWDGIFWINLTNTYAYHVNRLGTLSFKSDGSVTYVQVSPFFSNSTLPNALVSPVSNTFSFSPTGTQNASGNYSLELVTLTNESGQSLGNRVYLRWNSSSSIMGNLYFEVIIIKDKNILITFPFYRQ